MCVCMWGGGSVCSGMCVYVCGVVVVLVVECVCMCVVWW